MSIASIGVETKSVVKILTQSVGGSHSKGSPVPHSKTLQYLPSTLRGFSALCIRNPQARCSPGALVQNTGSSSTPPPRCSPPRDTWATPTTWAQETLSTIGMTPQLGGTTVHINTTNRKKMEHGADERGKALMHCFLYNRTVPQSNVLAVP